jgi:SAM-dependent methyltransferase
LRSGADTLVRNLNDRYIRHFLSTELDRFGSAKVSMLLDVGCGDLRYLDLYERAANVVVGLDVQARSPAVSVLGSATRLPFQDEVFDIVVCSEVIEHVDRPKNVLADVDRVLKPGGVFLLTFPFLHGLHETPNDYVRLTEFALAAWLLDTRLTCQRFIRRGGAVAVVYTITTEFLYAAVAAVVRRRRMLSPVAWIADHSLSALHALSFKLSILRARQLSLIGDGLRGARGQLAHWPLGYCFVLRKAALAPEKR